MNEKQFIKSSDLPDQVVDLIDEKGDEVYNILRNVEARYVFLILVHVISDFVYNCELDNKEFALKESLFSSVTETLKHWRNDNTQGSK